MNRQTKRLLAKQEAAAEKARQKAAISANVKARTAQQQGEREGRLKRWRRFLKEVRQELKKVAWPTRQEVVTYTIVVLVSVTFVTLLVFGLDYLFSEGLLNLYGT